MEKRTILAIALSFLVIFFWSKFMYRPEIQQQPQPAASVVASVAPAQLQPFAQVISSKAAESQTIEQTYRILGSTVTVADPIGAIKKVTFDSYKDNPYYLNLGFYIADPGLAFVKKIDVNNGFSYIYEDKVKRVIKTVYSSNSSYGMDLEVKVVNISPSSISFDFPIILGRIDLDNQASGLQRYDDIIISDQVKASHPNFKKQAVFQGIKFIGMRDQYFCAIIQPEAAGSSGFVNKVSDKLYDIGIAASKIDILPGNQSVQRYKVYLGPQDTDLINKSNPNWGSIVYFGMFDIVGQTIFGLLKFLFAIVRNWGLAIILLSIAIYLILFPLTVKQMRSMKEMQILQPKMEAINKAYSNNPAKKNEEVMKLYKEHKVNPLSGCLPMILQIPVFFSFFQVLSRSVVLKGSSFLWIKDLSAPDRLFRLPVSIPFVGEYFNILPILMAIGMFVQQKMSSVNASGQSAEQQKIMMIMLPIMFGAMFYNGPAGLVLYWFTNNTLMLFYQIKVMKSK